MLFDKKHRFPKVPNTSFNKNRTFLNNTIRRPIEEINSVSKIADILYNRYGTGTFNLLFYGYARNKIFRRNFTCVLNKGETCIHYDNGKCNKWKNLAKGKGCKKNPVFCWNFRKRGMITIIPNEKLVLSGYQKPYRVIWHKSQDKMGRLRIGFERDI